MKLYFDTSALMKKYICETGSENTDKLFLSASEIYISIIGHVEAVSSFRRLLLEKEIEKKDYELLKSEIAQDFKFFNVIDVSSEIVYYAVRIIDKYQLKSLDSLHLAAALAVKTDIDFFISSDQKLLKAAETEGFKVINPNE